MKVKDLEQCAVMSLTSRLEQQVEYGRTENSMSQSLRGDSSFDDVRNEVVIRARSLLSTCLIPVIPSITLGMKW